MLNWNVDNHPESKMSRSIGIPIPVLLAIAAAMPAVPAFAQINLSGVWSNRLHEDNPDRLPGPELGDYAGLPINAADRMRALTWDASLITLPEYQCRVHP